jgi:hypothetical protein
MHNLLLNEGCDSRITLMPDTAHEHWDLHYNSPEFLDWLVRQTKPTPEMKAQAELFSKITSSENSIVAKIQ